MNAFTNHLEKKDIILCIYAFKLQLIYYNWPYFNSLSMHVEESIV